MRRAQGRAICATSRLGAVLAALLVTQDAAAQHGSGVPIPPIRLDDPLKAPTNGPFTVIEVLPVLPSELLEEPGLPDETPGVPECDACERVCADCIDWSKVPTIEKFPRPGYFFGFPGGEGYYSALDVITGNYRTAPPKYGYPRFGLLQFSNFNVDWRYLENPDNQDFDYLDFLKRIHLDDNFVFTAGGDFRVRYNNEQNSRLSGRDNSYELIRTRVYGDLLYRDKFRFFVEFIEAHSFNQELAPLPIDENYADLLNVLGEINLCKLHDVPVYLRVGRQELLYGAQRLISPLEWGNTRRTFQGAKLFRHSETLDVDFFAVQPVIPDAAEFDSVDDDAFFSGLWLTWRPREKQNADLFILNLDQERTGQPQFGIPSGQTGPSSDVDYFYLQYVYRF